MDARPFFDLYQIPLTDKIIFKPTNDDILRAKTAVNNYLSNTHNNINILNGYTICEPTLYIGLVASSDKFIS